jgi:hypothetical protein
MVTVSLDEHKVIFQQVNSSRKNYLKRASCCDVGLEILLLTEDYFIHCYAGEKNSS